MHPSRIFPQFGTCLFICSPQPYLHSFSLAVFPESGLAVGFGPSWWQPLLTELAAVISKAAATVGLLWSHCSPDKVQSFCHLPSCSLPPIPSLWLSGGKSHKCLSPSTRCGLTSQGRSLGYVQTNGCKQMEGEQGELCDRQVTYLSHPSSGLHTGQYTRFSLKLEIKSNIKRNSIVRVKIYFASMIQVI